MVACSILGCKSNTSQKIENITFFRQPLKNRQKKKRVEELRMAVPYYNWRLEMYARRELRKAQRAQLRDVANPFGLPDKIFQHLYGVNKDMAHYVTERLQADLKPRGDGPPAYIKVLLSIQFMANGGYTRQLGQDPNLCVGQTTVSKYIGQFVDATNRRLLNEWVHFPGTEAARAAVSEKFGLYGVPGVLGCIDCTHVRIVPPSGAQGQQYMNCRKQAHTINVQLISDAESRIINVNARFPGSVHESFIWRQSLIRQEMEKLHQGRLDYFLLGDSGYPLEPWLMTPILNADEGTAEDRYTQWHCKVRNSVERTIRYLQGSLRCLDRTLHYAPEKASQIIYACCALYNLMKHFGVPLNEQQEDHEEVENQHAEPDHLLRLAQTRRNNLVQTYF